MADYRVIEPCTLMSGGVMTGTSVISSSAMNVLHLTLACFQAIWTGTPNGSFKAEGSIDGINFDNLNITITAVTGAAGNRIVVVPSCAPKYVRLTYTNTSSAGTLTILGCAGGI